MKYFAVYIRYIGLLIFSGLILPFYKDSAACLVNKAVKHIHVSSHPGNNFDKTDVSGFSLFHDIIGTFFPVLKD